MLAEGGLTFQLNTKASFLNLMLLKKEASKWKKHWFYVSESTPDGEVPLLVYTAKQSEPRRLQVAKLP